MRPDQIIKPGHVTTEEYRRRLHPQGIPTPLWIQLAIKGNLPPCIVGGKKVELVLSEVD